MTTQYLLDLLAGRFGDFIRKKVILEAPTGMGKTTMVIEGLLPYLRSRGMKLLILCNRKLLRQQYWYSLVQKYDNCTELMESIELMTYQKLAEQIRNKSNWEDLFADFQVIVCDEAHYFYADSDFNGFGTYALLHAITIAGMCKGIIFLSATMKEVRPLIKTVIQNCWTKFSRQRREWSLDEECKEIIDLNYNCYADYGRFHCVAVADEDALYKMLLDSPNKSVVFIDDKKKGREMKDKIIKTGRIASGQISVLNAENLDDDGNDDVIESLVISHKLIPKIMITTSVLDNGVSIQDSDVRNLVVITESRCSFLQMIGRVRMESTAYCNLFFLIRNKDIFQHRMNQCKKWCDDYDSLMEAGLSGKLNYFYNIMWDYSDDKVDFYRNAVVAMRHEYHFFSLPNRKVQGLYGDVGLYPNTFARRKVGDLHLIESRFYALAVNDPLQVVYEQMAWLEKEPDELEIQGMDYRKQREDEFVSFLLRVKGYTSEELSEFKTELVKTYRKDFFQDILAKNGGISNGKLKLICEKYGLVFQDKLDKKSRKKAYFIQRKGDRNEDKVLRSICPERSGNL